MNNLSKAIWEHLKTKKKYNTLLLKYEVAREDLEKKQVELNTQKRNENNQLLINLHDCDDSIIMQRFY